VIDPSPDRNDHPLMNVVSIWPEARAVLEGAALHRARPQLHRDVPPGDGSPVLLIPGYLAGDSSLAPVAGWLRQLGYRPEHAAIMANVDCATRTTARLLERLKSITAAYDEPALIVGHSLGGVLGRVLAVRRPELVRGLVCLGSPLTDLTAVNPLIRANAWVLGRLGDLGVRGLLSRGCLSGDCCGETRRLIGEPFPAGSGFVSIYSRSDGIVNWRACLDPHAEHVEVESSHVGMAINPGVYRAMAIALAGFANEPTTSSYGLAA
jgi:triacylglycerol lipase